MVIYGFSVHLLFTSTHVFAFSFLSVFLYCDSEVCTMKKPESVQELAALVLELFGDDRCDVRYISPITVHNLYKLAANEDCEMDCVFFDNGTRYWHVTVWEVKDIEAMVAHLLADQGGRRLYAYRQGGKSTILKFPVLDGHWLNWSKELY
jgi:hypothetical protein